jgi:hypothetical protein
MARAACQVAPGRPGCPAPQEILEALESPAPLAALVSLDPPAAPVGSADDLAGRGDEAGRSRRGVSGWQWPGGAATRLAAARRGDRGRRHPSRLARAGACRRGSCHRRRGRRRRRAGAHPARDRHPRYCRRRRAGQRRRPGQHRRPGQRRRRYGCPGQAGRRCRLDLPEHPGCRDPQGCPNHRRDPPGCRDPQGRPNHRRDLPGGPDCSWGGLARRGRCPAGRGCRPGRPPGSRRPGDQGRGRRRGQGHARGREARREAAGYRAACRE